MQMLTLENNQYLPEVCRCIDEGNQVCIPATGTSMRPWIEPGRHGLVLGHADSYQVGDVALAEVAPGHYVVHRIVAIHTPEGKPVKGLCSEPLARVTLKGDGCVEKTERCTLRRLRARLVAITTQHPHMGRTRQTDTTSRPWRLYSRAWMWLSPLRRPLLALHRLIRHHQLPARWTKKKQHTTHEHQAWL